MKYGIKDKIKFFILGICTVVDVLYFLLMDTMLILTLFEPEPPIPGLSMVIMTIHAVLLLCISINGIVRIKNGQKRVLISGFFMKLLATWMGLGLLFLIAGAVVAAICMFIIGSIVGGVVIVICRSVDEGKFLSSWGEISE